MDYRTLAAGGLGVLLGVVLVAAPEVIVRVHTAGRLPPERRGGYGADGALSTRHRLAVRAVGVVLLLIGLYFGARGLA